MDQLVAYRSNRSMRSPGPVRALRRLLLVASLVLMVAPSMASAGDPFLPPKGKVFAGVAMGSSIRDFQRRTGTHPAVWEQFIRWRGGSSWTFRWARNAHTRLMLAIGTSRGQGLPESISPGEIARGEGDRWILHLARVIAREGRPVYIRLLAEMNNCDLPYAGYDCSGSPRSASHSARRFKQAWKRVVLLMRGGEVARINK